MKLITKELEKRFAEVGDQSQSSNPLIIAKFFNPCGSETWYISEWDKDADRCFGYIEGMWEDEWGYVSIRELEELRLPFGLSIERDRFFKEIRFKELIKEQDLER
ncbi:DUF2958 domain-containing protein [Chryseobacterium aquaticum]|uniref:DUF2958 domain-containing protein n=1 Tax=Chryseobacterium aquaticum TaxID=452084 RepID=A0A848N9E3_9FLAO|nr:MULTISPECIES: DUF2958 domain-containing protein [Chryseobacterium]NMR34959.1 DUF2958 domain-containing protein [Chryseobacterium aquaticum]NRQ47177.1 DUF2958 domain-containing protein [Chryseobacterium sp. C-204]